MHRASWDVGCPPSPSSNETALPVSLPSLGASVTYAALSGRLTLVPQNRLSLELFLAYFRNFVSEGKSPFLSQQTLVFRKNCLPLDSSDLCFPSPIFPVCFQTTRVVISPLLRRHLQVFLDCPSHPQCTVRVKVGGGRCSHASHSMSQSPSAAPPAGRAASVFPSLGEGREGLPLRNTVFPCL